MHANRRQVVVLIALVAVLAAVAWWQWGDEPARPAGVPAISRAQPGQARPGNAAAREPADLPQVALSLLAQPPSEPADTGRDPFKFGTSQGRRESGSNAEPGDPPGRSPDAGGTRPGAAGGATATPQAPPPPPPIPLKFIGLVQKQGENVMIAVLSDARGVYHGREGDVIEGRYRIVRIGRESVEMVYVDGRGRQVIRLSGA